MSERDAGIWTPEAGRTWPRAGAGRRRARAAVRRGFNLVELLLALAITATLLTATMVALDASFNAYQRTTEVASTHTISRLAMHRILTLIRTGREFAPRPDNPLDRIRESTFIDFRLPPTEEIPEGEIVSIEWEQDEEAIYIRIGGGEERHLLLEGVVAQYFPPGHEREGELIMPFILEYESGFTLYRATLDLLVKPDDNMTLSLDGDYEEFIHLVATSMPRVAAHESPL